MAYKRLTITEIQAQFLLRVLKNWVKLRKSHFYEINGGMKSEKIGNESLMVKSLTMQLEDMLSGVEVEEYIEST